MGISDIITLISLIIAILAIVSEERRKYFLLKFSLFNYLSILALFLLINYFVFFNYFKNNDFYFASLFFDSSLLPIPISYSYILSLFILSICFYKLLVSFFPYGKKEKVLRYYESLIHNQQHEFLIELLSRFHKSNLIKVLTQSTSNPPAQEFYIHELFKKKKKNCFNHFFKSVVRYFFPSGYLNKSNYSKEILSRVLSNNHFVRASAPLRPYFFAEIFSCYKGNNQRIYSQESIRIFFESLIESENSYLKSEIEEAMNYEEGLSGDFFNNNKILSCILQDLDVAFSNEVWAPFLNKVFLELDKNNGINDSLKIAIETDSFLLDFSIFYAIQFHKILILQIIHKKHSSTKMPIGAYVSFVSTITRNLKTEYDYFPDERSTYYRLIEILFDHTNSFLKLSVERDCFLLQNITLSINGMCYYFISDNDFSLKLRKRILTRLITLYMDLINENQFDVNRLLFLDEIFKKNIAYNVERETVYFMVLRETWSEFDKIPFTTPDESIGYIRFTSVILSSYNL